MRTATQRQPSDALDRARGYENLEPWFHRMAEADGPQRKALRARIIEQGLPLADHIARRFSGRNENVDDLEQAARLGLVLAVDRFDVSRGKPFLAYAIPTIMGEVRRHFRDYTWAVHVPRPVKDLNSRTAAAAESLTHRLKRAPTCAEVAAELGVGTDELTLAQLASNGYRSDPIDTGSDDDDTPGTPAKAYSVEEPCYSLIEEAMTLRPLLTQLPEHERELLVMRFYESMSQTQIAQRIGASQISVSRRLFRTLDRLRCQALPADG
ncbi:SigB/SigF/SigG family RNA polymerase sigma factor [Nocardia mexicana]|uniref:RNA polymerase sigma-B factor n=1 Tax=Nocardia mexicana TaxID=279262 RepID=A0A370HEP7_9NOCA|nr:SigB/SigF/SigG family RNA polymerase sigma factor [Nocardia mexicana]RDI53363.1 RNA polymerase sigma-B factor [Nocardia mexicana]